MINPRLTALLFLFTLFISGLHAQAFNPVNGTAYAVEFTDWEFTGNDRMAGMQGNIRSGTITFNRDNTVMSFGNALYTAAFTFRPDGRCDIAVRALLVRRSFSGTGRVERSGRDFTVFLSMPREGDSEEMPVIIKGVIK